MANTLPNIATQNCKKNNVVAVSFIYSFFDSVSGSARFLFSLFLLKLIYFLCPEKGTGFLSLHTSIILTLIVHFCVILLFIMWTFPVNVVLKCVGLHDYF